MKRGINLVSLLVIASSLTACSTPTIHKPSFEKYGRAVSTDYFTNEYNLYRTDALSNLLVPTDNTMRYFSGFRKKVKVSCINSSERKYVDVYDMKKATVYSQTEKTAIVDPYNNRISIETSQKTYGVGDKDLVEKICGSTMKKQVTKFYGEIIGERFNYVYVTDRVYYYSMVSETKLLDLGILDSTVLNYVNFERYNYSCYINKNVYTFAGSSSDNQSTNITHQFKFGKTVSMKIQRHYLGNGIYDPWTTPAYVYTEETSFEDYSIGATTSSVKKIDYSEYNTY